MCAYHPPLSPRLFPHVNVMTELHYRYNMRYLQPDNYIMSGGVRVSTLPPSENLIIRTECIFVQVQMYVYTVVIIQV